MTEGGALVLVAPAKVNLFLRVLAREEGGFHQLETLFQRVALGDRITLRSRREPGIALEIEGADLGRPEENLAWRAAEAVLSAAGSVGVPDPGGVEIRLEKRIPHGAGLGGGSSDAATVLRGVNHLLGDPLAPPRLLELATSLGADVPGFLSPSPTTLAWGRGERLLALAPLPKAPILLALPSFGVPTPEAYRALSEGRARAGGGGAPGRGAALLEPETLATWEGVRRVAENDFEGPVFALHPLLGAVREALTGAGAEPALLSGSGSALFGVFGDAGAARRAAQSLGSAFPGVRFLETRTLTGS